MSKDNLASSSDSRWCGFTTPHTDTNFNLSIRVDEIQDLDDAPIKFVYGKDLLPGWALTDCPLFMQRFNNWYKRACRLGLRTIYALHLRMYSELRGLKSLISRSILKTSSTCSISKNLVLKWFDSGACECS